MIKESTVKKFLDCGINVIGVNDHKEPAEGSWGKYQTEFREPQDISGSGLALVCGHISGNLEVVDIDTKYDLTSSLYNDYCALIRDNSDDLLDKLMIIQTPSGGYHFLYRCDKIQGNQKLSRREATEEELKIKREKWKVLIETRGEGGYIASIPSKGYVAIQGKFSEIPRITEQERDVLLSCARTFDEEVSEVRIPKSTMNISGLTPWDDYDNRHTCLELLNGIGWSVVKEDSRRIYVKRSGDSTAMHSGNILKDRELFKAFSSSTEFEPEKAYSPFGMYAVIYHGGDFSSAAKQLYRDGYGEQNKEVRPIEQFEQAPQDITSIAEHISDPIEDDKYLDSVRSGTLEVGLTTGSTVLDEYFRFKRAKFCVIVGHSNVGKTTALLYISCLPAVLHGWCGAVIAKENSSGFTKRKIMEFFICKPLTAMTDEEYTHAKRWIDEHFIIVKARGGVINDIPKLLKLCYKIADERKLDFILADPYSGFGKDQKRGENSHEYDYRMASEVLDFTERTGVTMYLNAHTNTEARRKRDDDGNLVCPWVDDVEGGGKWSNRADQGIVLHRRNKAEGMLRYITEFHVDKERETETGGKPTERDRPIQMLLEKNMCEFTINGINPIRKWHEENGTVGFKKFDVEEQIQKAKEYSMEPNKGFDNEQESESDVPF